MTIENGVAPSSGAGAGDVDGGGIRVKGTLTLSDSTLTGNAVSTGSGGGLSTDAESAVANVDNVQIVSNGQAHVGSCGGVAAALGRITVTDSVISDNTSGYGGAGCEEGDASTALSIISSTVSGNSVPGPVSQGGGFAENGLGTITIDHSTLTNNTAQAGGALIDEGGGAIDVTDSTISGNQAQVRSGGSPQGENGVGGAILSDGNDLITVTGTTISANSAGSEGGAIFAFGSGTNSAVLAISNSTITGNSSGAGGGALRLDDGAIATVANSTIDANTAGTGGQIGICDSQPIFVVPGGCHATLTLTDTIVDGGLPVNCSATGGGIVSSGSNLDSDSSCGLTAPGDINGRSALLGPLANNGGPTQTQALGVGSPAIDAVISRCPPPATDQRGVSRPQGAACDIGAFEAPPRRPTSTTVACAPSTVLAGTPTQCTVTVTDTDMGTATDPIGVVTLGGSSCSLAPSATPAAAVCTVAYIPVTGGPQMISASYSGDATHLPSSGGTSLTVTLRPTATAICPQTSPTPGGGTCASTVTDTGPGPRSTPTGTLAWFASYGATTQWVGSCTLLGGASAGTASCTPPTFAPPDSEYAVYQGDSTHSPSTSQTVRFVHTYITAGPSGFTSSAPEFMFTSSVAGATFQCRLDGHPFVSCVSGVIYYELAYGPHTFIVRAVAPNGDVDPVGATASFALGQGTLTPGCTLAVPSYHGPLVPVGVDPEVSCRYTAICPALSSCVVTAGHANADDQQVGFASAYNDVDNGSSFLCSSNGDVNSIFFACPVDRPPAVPQRFTSSLGATCYADHVIVPAQDAGGIGQVSCALTVLVSPIVPLGVLGSGPGGGVTVFVPGPGKLFAGLLGAAAQDRAPTATSAAVKPLRFVVKRSGPVTVPIRLGPSAAARLHRRHRLAITLRLTFIPRHGPQITKLDRVTLISPVCTHGSLPRTHFRRITVCR